MTNDKNEKCKKCGTNLYASDSIKAGYCISCAGNDSEARKAWEDSGLAKFCSKCGQMLHASDSIKSGICTYCAMTNGQNGKK